MAGSKMQGSCRCQAWQATTRHLGKVHDSSMQLNFGAVWMPSVKKAAPKRSRPSKTAFKSLLNKFLPGCQLVAQAFKRAFFAINP
jgi:hypothetical protein